MSNTEQQRFAEDCSSTNLEFVRAKYCTRIMSRNKFRLRKLWGIISSAACGTFKKGCFRRAVGYCSLSLPLVSTLLVRSQLAAQHHPVCSTTASALEYLRLCRAQGIGLCVPRCALSCLMNTVPSITLLPSACSRILNYFLLGRQGPFISLFLLSITRLPKHHYLQGECHINWTINELYEKENKGTILKSAFLSLSKQQQQQNNWRLCYIFVTFRRRTWDITVCANCAHKTCSLVSWHLE